MKKIQSAIKKRTFQMVSETHVFGLMKQYYANGGIVQLQFDSFNNFLINGLSQIIDEEPTITVEVGKNRHYTVYFSDVTVDRPYLIEQDRRPSPITPAACRLRDLTYDAPVCVNIVEELIENGEILESKQHIKIPIARIPIMIRSIKCALHGKSKKSIIKAGECIRDPGGYFIIKGKETKF